MESEKPCGRISGGDGGASTQCESPGVLNGCEKVDK